MQKEVLRIRDVEDMIGLRKSAIYAAMAAGNFPAPIKLTARSVGWRRSDVLAWLADRPAARPAA